MFGMSKDKVKELIEREVECHIAPYKKSIESLQLEVKKLKQPNKPEYKVIDDLTIRIIKNSPRLVDRGIRVGKLNHATWEYDEISRHTTKLEAQAVVDCLNGTRNPTANDFSLARMKANELFGKCEPDVKKPSTAKKKGKQNVK